MSVSTTRRAFGLSVAASALMASVAQAQKADKPLYKDPKADITSRVEDLIKRMTLEEKVAQMICIWKEKAKIQTDRGDFVLRRPSRPSPMALV